MAQIICALVNIVASFAPPGGASALNTACTCKSSSGRLAMAQRAAETLRAALQQTNAAQTLKRVHGHGQAAGRWHGTRKAAAHRPASWRRGGVALKRDHARSARAAATWCGGMFRGVSRVTGSAGVPWLLGARSAAVCTSLAAGISGRGVANGQGADNICLWA